ncbi:minor capsid protein [Eubacterium pyruvativorans]|uniref:minor capsid protein n=1 Tax=Eubacterium pyruvativorans TaxID=155865 RepID=UPI00087F89B0|nr:minor capsid protein [Eubacterium pyruvativorans]SDF30935.1 phage putative head morphogenesis protein, SPP1 gp7 family [Eubacterium pyruvativorans]
MTTKKAKNRSADYWKKRSIELENASHQRAVSTYKEIEKAFQSAQADLEESISKWIVRIARNNEISITDAKRLLDADELEEFHWTVEEYIKRGEENAVTQQWIKQLENASAKVHIQRLEALKIDTQNALENAYAIYNSSVDDMARKVYEDGYYKTAYMLEKGTGLGRKISTIDQRKLSNVIVKPWAVDGKNFSTRIWEDKSRTINGLHQALTQAAIKGGKPDDAIKALTPLVRDTVKKKKFAAGRLVQTEQAYFHARSSLDCFSELGVDKLEFIATLDSRTSEICQSMDGVVFAAKDAEIGVNVPPLHPNCRSVTAPYFEDDAGQGMRAARDPETGKTYYVPDNIAYKQWRGEYVGEPEDPLIAKYGETREILGENTPSIEEYRRIQYNKNRKSSFDSYKRMIRSGELTPLATFELFEKTEKQLRKELKNLTTSNGIAITGYSKHCVARVVGSVEQRRNGVEVSDLVEALKSKESKIGKVKTRKDGNKSQRFISHSAMVTVNPDTGIVIQVNPYRRRK